VSGPISTPISVSVCIGTFRRQAFLIELLTSIASQAETVGLEVVVSEDDPDESARSSVEAFARAAPFPVRYVVSAARNVSVARNVAIAAATRELVLLLDDDQTLEKDFLGRLAAAWARIEGMADIAIIHRVARFEPGPVSPLARAFYRWPQHADGEAVRPGYGRSGGVLMRRARIERLGLTFDVRLGRTSGEDNAYFLEATRRGARVVWVGSAVVIERVSASRATTGAVLKRSISMGERWSIYQTIDARMGTRLRLAVLASCQLLVSLLLLLVGVFLGRDKLLQTCLLVARQFGKLRALLVGARRFY